LDQGQRKSRARVFTRRKGINLYNGGAILAAAIRKGCWMVAARAFPPVYPYRPGGVFASVNTVFGLNVGSSVMSV